MSLPLFTSDEELRDKIEGYFSEKKNPTITGLAYYIGFESRQSFYDYEQKTEFTYTIRKVRLFIEQHYEEMLQTGNTIGAIFALKNFGWKDRQEIESDGKVEVTVKYEERDNPS